MKFGYLFLKDRLLWFEADIVKRPYLRHCYRDFEKLYINYKLRIFSIS